MRKRFRQGGYLRITSPDCGKDYERDTYTCRHCNKLVEVTPMCRPEDMGRACGGCDGLLCVPCSAKNGCSHIEKRLEVWEQRGRLRREMGVLD